MFNSFESFNKKNADIIIGFYPEQGDTIGVSSEAFPSLSGKTNIKFASTSSRKELKRLFKEDYDFIYFEKVKSGRLFFNGNGSDKGCGSSAEGGLFAILKGTPDLTALDFSILD